MVPEGWVHTTFGEHIDCLTGLAFKSSGYSENDEDVRLLRGDNIEPGGLRWNGAKFWPSSDMGNLKRYQLLDGDFVIAMDRTWITAGLKVAEVQKSDLPCLLVQRVARVRAKASLEQSLLRQYFSRDRFEQYVKSVQTATAVPHISPNDIKGFPVELPPLPEQKKIAKILSIWDKAITTTEQLLASSQQQKKALMQQLLTGKKRLLDGNGIRFSSEWRVSTLGELGNTYSGLTGKTKIDFGKGKSYIPYINIFRNPKIDIEAMEKVSISSDEKQVQAKFGDLFFTTSSEILEEVGMSSVLLDQADELYLNSFCFGFRLDSFEFLKPEYARYLLRSEQVRRAISIMGQGATRYNLSKKQLIKLELKLPSVQEQQKVAAVLSTADQEITSLQQKLHALKQEKKALMQQLLTGKRRVKLN